MRWAEVTEFFMRKTADLSCLWYAPDRATLPHRRIEDADERRLVYCTHKSRGVVSASDGGSSCGLVPALLGWSVCAGVGFLAQW
jgi:hypothetical protein